MLRDNLGDFVFSPKTLFPHASSQTLKANLWPVLQTVYLRPDLNIILLSPKLKRTGQNSGFHISVSSKLGTTIIEKHQLYC